MTPGDLIHQLQTWQERLADPTPVLRAIGDLMVASVDRNFEAEGRPEKWAPLKPATVRRKAKAGKSRILLWSGKLAASIASGVDVSNGKVTLGSTLPYARIHQQGGVIERKAKEGTLRLRTDARGDLLRQGASGRKKNLAVFATKNHVRAVERAFTSGAYDIPMPARPYLVMQPGEQEAYGAIFWHFVLTGQIKRNP
jgi:phage gpG-like protein